MFPLSCWIGKFLCVPELSKMLHNKMNLSCVFGFGFFLIQKNYTNYVCFLTVHSAFVLLFSLYTQSLGCTSFK